MPNRDRESLDDMLRAARRILQYAQGTTRETLPQIPMRLDAILYEIVVLGEAARHISPELRTDHSAVILILYSSHALTPKNLLAQFAVQ